jgi:hypothetical protein
VVVTAVSCTVTVPAPRDLPEMPIEAGASAHLDPRYVAARRIHTARLPDHGLEFRGRHVEVHSRVLHHRRAGLLDIVIDVDDEEAASYLATYERTESAATAELFTRRGDRLSVAALLRSTARELTGDAPDPHTSSAIQRLVFHRGEDDAPGTELPGVSPGHHVAVGPNRLDVVSDSSTVLSDERLGYAMMVGLCARARLLADDLTRGIDLLATAAGDVRNDVRHVLDRAAETQRRAVVVEREITAYRLLSPPLQQLHERVDDRLGLGHAGRADIDRSVESLRRLTESLVARTVEERTRTWERYGAAGLVLLVVVAATALMQILG